MTDELYYRSATELAAMLRAKQVSAREVVTAHLDRIDAVNPRVNAIVTLTAERALEQAAAAGRASPPAASSPVRCTDFRWRTRTTT